MNAKKRVRNLISQLKAEKNKALKELEKEYKAKRQKIEDEYDLSGLDSCVLMCKICDEKDPVWTCKKACKYRVCQGCLKSIYTARVNLMKKSLRILKLKPCPLQVAKNAFLKQGLRCPACRSVSLPIDFEGEVKTRTI